MSDTEKRDLGKRIIGMDGCHFFAQPANHIMESCVVTLTEIKRRLRENIMIDPPEKVQKDNLLQRANLREKICNLTANTL